MCELQWDKVENKTSVAVYAGGAVVALWLSSTIVGAVNAVPLVRATLYQKTPKQHHIFPRVSRESGVIPWPEIIVGTMSLASIKARQGKDHLQVHYGAPQNRALVGHLKPQCKGGGGIHVLHSFIELHSREVGLNEAASWEGDEIVCLSL